MGNEDTGPQEHGPGHDPTPPPGPPEETEETEQAAEGADTLRRRQATFALAALAALVIGGVAWLGLSDDPPPPSTTTTTTTTTTASTTTAPLTRPATRSQVATALPEVEVLAVRSTPPPEWDAATPVLTWEAPVVPASADTTPPRSDLPRVDYPIRGRYATAEGWDFSNPSSFGDPLTLLVTETRGDWAKVMVPVRPNHTEGWVHLDDVELSEHDYRIQLDISDRRLVAWAGREKIADTSVVVGKDETRTPTGRFFITDVVEQDNPSGFYGPYVLPLNGYSEQLDLFDDGVPVIAIHGTSRPELVGQAASNGCVRIPNDVVTLLRDRLPLGTPVEIQA